MSKKELLEELSKLKMNLKSADPKRERFKNPYHKAHTINADINEIKGKLANLGHNVNNSNYKSDNGDNNDNSSTYSAEAYRTNEYKENRNSPKRSKSKKAHKTRRFKALNRYKAKPKTRRHHR
jgi:hypothetical protein